MASYERLDEFLNGLAPDELPIMLGKIVAKLISIQQAQASAQAHESASSNGVNQADRLLSRDEARAMLNCSASFLYHNHKRLGISRKLGNGTLRYSLRAIQKLIKDPIRAQRLASRPE